MSRYLFLIALAGCSSENATEAPAPEPALNIPENLPDVVFITLDTTRADRLGAYGYENALTDTFDALAEKGRVYERAYSPLPLTIPSHASMFTGNYPPTLEIRSNGAGKLDPEDYTLAEHLKTFGYTTVASVAAFVTSRTWGFDQGFDAFFDDIPHAKGSGFWHAERPGNLVVDDVLAFHEKRTDAGPLFAWVHLYDPHYPYLPPPEYFERSDKRPYQAEIAYVDDQVERLVQAFPDALFVIAGDHGEGLGEHQELTHGMFVYDSTQRVPLILSGPGVEPSRVDEPVSLVDIAPTLLKLLGLPPLGDTEGRVVPADSADSPDSTDGRPVYMETYQVQQRFGIAPPVAVVEGRYKLIDLPKPELYDLIADPGEKVNLAEQHPTEVERLRKILVDWDYGPPLRDPSHPADPEVTMQLQALGYQEGGFAGSLDGPLPDPKDKLGTIVKSQAADRAMQEGKLDKVGDLLDQLIEENPQSTEFRSRRAALHARKGDLERAGELIEDAIRLDPDNAVLKMTLGTQRARAGQFREASELFREAAEALPFTPRVRAYAVASLLDAEGGTEEALELGFQYLQAYPDDLAVLGLVAVELTKRGAVKRGAPMLKRAATAKVPEREVAFLLSAMELGDGNRDEARRLLELEIKHHPRHERARLALVRLLSGMEDWMAVATVTEWAVEKKSDNAQLWHSHAQALFNLGRFAEVRTVLDAALERFPDVSYLLLLDANLMVKEGVSMDQAKVRFEQSKVAKQREDAKLAADQAATLAAEEAAPVAADEAATPAD